MNTEHRVLPEERAPGNIRDVLVATKTAGHLHIFMFPLSVFWSFTVCAFLVHDGRCTRPDNAKHN